MPILTTEYLLLFCFALAIVAFLYASVGHGGASGYLALMILFSFSITAIKINALVLNCFVSAISFFFFSKVKKINFKLFYPFAIASIPASFLGGYLDLNETFVKIVLGIVLLFSIVYINGFLNKKTKELKPVQLPIALLFGFFIGLLSGMIGIGGGIILTPLLLILGWSTIKDAASVSALFIFVNSIAGILGYIFKGNSFQLFDFKMVPFAIIGGFLGSFVGSHYFSSKHLRYVLSVVVLFASIKLIFS